MKPWEGLLLALLLIVIVVVVLSLPDNPLPTRCLDVWCLDLPR